MLTNCRSASDLIASFRLVFSDLKWNKLRPYVDRSNQTIVGQLVREFMTAGDISKPSLIGKQSFFFLAEMGVEKLKRDYIYTLVSQSLALRSDLDNFFTPGQELKHHLNDLKKLQGLVEVVMLLGSSLNLHMTSLREIVQHMLTHYAQAQVDQQHVFEFSVRATEVCHVITSTKLESWQVEFDQQVGGGEDTQTESSLYCLCASHPFLHMEDVTCEDESVDTESEEPHQEHYYLVKRKESVVLL